VRSPESTRSLILTQAGTLFNVQGYKATSLSDITAATGLTKGAIYGHFLNKEALEEQALDYMASRVFEIMRAKIKAQTTAGDKLRAVFAYFKSYLQNPPITGGCPILNAAIEVDDGHPSLKARAQGNMEVLKASVATILQNGINRGQLRGDMDVRGFTAIIIASLEGAIMMGKLSGTTEDLLAVVAHLEQTLAYYEQLN
jgi:TetR/AcrR family transcriptional regulator, transcriptional repressor for nem operon